MLSKLNGSVLPILSHRSAGTCSQMDISNLEVRLRPIPNSSLCILEQIPRVLLPVWRRVFGELTGFRVEATDDVRVHGCIPNIVVVIYSDSVWRRHRSRNLEHLKRLGLRIETCERSTEIVTNPDIIL